MKLRRFTEAGVEAVRKALHDVEKAGDLAPATATIPSSASRDAAQTRR